MWHSISHRVRITDLVTRTTLIKPSSYVLCTGSGILGVSIGLNALSTHAACTVWWSLIATIVVAACASVRTFQNIGWLTWAGFISIFTAVLIVVYASSQSTRLKCSVLMMSSTVSALLLAIVQLRHLRLVLMSLAITRLRTRHSREG